MSSAAAAAFVGTGSQVARAQTRTPLVVETSTPFDVLLFFYGMEHGLFEKAGLDITTQVVASGSLAMVAITGGSAQLGYSNNLSLIGAFAKGIPVQMVAPGGGYNAAAPNVQLCVDGDSPLRSGKDLEGHVVAVAGLHDLFSVSARAWATSSGGDITKIHFVELPPSAMLASLKAKRVDAFVIYDPFRTAAIAAGARPIGAPFDAIAKQFLTGAWFASGDWLKANHDAAVRFARVIHDAAAYTNTHFDELVPLIATYAKSTPEIVRQSAKAIVPPSLTAASVQPLIDVSAKFGEIPASFRAAEIILPGVP